LCFPDGSEGELLEKQSAIKSSLINIKARIVVEDTGDRWEIGACETHKLDESSRYSIEVIKPQTDITLKLFNTVEKLLVGIIFSDE
jgi:hypothetical protein